MLNGAIRLNEVGDEVKILKRVKKMVGNATGKNDLAKWQERLRKNKVLYDTELAKMDRRDALYNGTNTIKGSNAKSAKYVRNVISEIIEAEVDSSVPMPKVGAKRPDDEDRAATIEAFLKNELDALPFEKINDMDERTTPIQGGDFFLVEWDNNRRTHSTLGGVRVSLLHPRQVIPQAGVNEIADMDYLFVLNGVTKKYIKRTYGVDVEDENEEFPEARSNGGFYDSTADDMVTLVTAYYKNKEGGIGVYRWVGDTEVQSLDDYYARQLKVCKKCGKTVAEDDKTCPYCGAKAFEYKTENTTQLDRDITLRSGEVLPQSQPEQYGIDYLYDDNGGIMLDMNGAPMMTEVLTAEARPSEVPAYKPDTYPIVLRRNISKNNSLLGGSDVDSIDDQQELIKKLGDKIQEKLLKGGSYVTFPKGVNIKKDNEELKVIEVKSPADIQSIQVLNIQPNISADAEYMNAVYQAARETIGITDSFQGRKDTTAQSGAAKQFAAAQSAGRLESKRVMKQAAYQEMFELMFKFMLAYADEPISTNSQNPIGDVEYGIFDRYDFLERDADGELYWNDDFLFSVDTTNNTAQNREALWSATKEAYQSGAFGNPQEIDTQIIYWAAMEKYRYPNAGNVCKTLKDKKKQMEEAQAVEMQGMQNGNGYMQGGTPVGGQIQTGIQMPQFPM